MDDTRAGQEKKDDPAQVARQGFEAMMAGKSQIIAGSIKTKLMGAAARVLPDKPKVQAHRHLSGQTRSVELAAIGRRVCETEFDLLGLLEDAS